MTQYTLNKKEKHNPYSPQTRKNKKSIHNTKKMNITDSLPTENKGQIQQEVMKKNLKNQFAYKGSNLVLIILQKMMINNQNHNHSKSRHIQGL